MKKGGTNEFHGEGGELFKNNPLVHRRFFQLQTTPQQHISDLFQMPDFVLSGPVIIPKLYNGKNRTFFEIGGIVPRGHLVQREQLFGPHGRGVGRQLHGASPTDLRSGLDQREFRRRQPVAHALSRQYHSRRTGSAACGMRS